MRIALVLLLVVLAAPVHAGQCLARSAAHTVALVELYTSEGCSSCPPADRWLSGLAARGYTAERVVPLALHVDYWDYIGWKDPYAKRDFSLRQRKLTQLQRLAGQPRPSTQRWRASTPVRRLRVSASRSSPRTRPPLASVPLRK
jgi:hypothetical protein